MDYSFQTEPMRHQREAFERARDASTFALVMEQGTGKSKVGIDIAAWKYMRGDIGALLIVCPSGLQRNWLEREVPTHLPEHVQYRSYLWDRPPNTKRQQAAIDSLYDSGYDLRIVAIHYDAIITEKGKKFLGQLMRCFDTMMLLDESHYIKTPSAKRTQACINFGKKPSVKSRLILSGTPILQGPLDLYSQFKFLDPDITGFTTFTAFKNHFAEWESIPTNNNRRGFYEKLVDYKNVEELEQAVAPYSYRANKADCLDLPPKVFQVQDVELTPKQRRIYDDLLEEGMAYLGESDLAPAEALWQALLDGKDVVRCQNALALHMRLQQVLGGWVSDSEGTLTAVDERNPRLDALVENMANGYQNKVLIWARFKHEVDAIAHALGTRLWKGDGQVLPCHGGYSKDDRQASVTAFQNDANVRALVATPDTIGRGQDLWMADTTEYYSCSFNFEHRSQSEDRMHRHGFRGESAVYRDYVAQGTIDERVVDALQRKRAMAEGFTWGGTVVHSDVESDGQS